MVCYALEHGAKHAIRLILDLYLGGCEIKGLFSWRDSDLKCDS